MESVRLSIPLSRDFLPDSFVQFYGAVVAGGNVDYETPISPRVRAWPVGATHPAHLQTPHLRGRHLSGLGFRGHLRGIHLQCPHLGFQDIAEWRGGQYYGPSQQVKTWKFGARIFDPAGRVNASEPSSAEEITLVIDSAPRPASGLAATAVDADGVTFSFTPSPDL